MCNNPNKDIISFAEWCTGQTLKFHQKLYLRYLCKRIDKGDTPLIPRQANVFKTITLIEEYKTMKDYVSEME